MPTGVYPRTEKTRKILSNAQKLRGTRPPSQKGKIPWNKGKTNIYSKDTINKIKLARSKQRIKHSAEARRKIGLAHSGEKSYLWKGGVSKTNRSLRKQLTETIDYKLWRTAVFERDDYTCLVCNRHGVRLHAHHIVRWSESVALREVVSNGATVCENCDYKLINHHEKEWEPIFRLILNTCDQEVTYV